jgi:uncharacterized RDD family membrane protein YckC
MDDRTPIEEPRVDANQSQESSAPEAASFPLAASPTPSSDLPLTASTQPEAFDRAGFWLRSVAFAIDLSALSLFSLLLLLASFLVSGMGAEVSGLDAAASHSFSLLSLVEVTEFIATAAYFTILHSETGQTIGKNLLGLEVCTLDGGRLSYGHALLRFLAYGPSLFVFGLGFLWVALNPGKRGWHDLLSGTMVISKYREQ